MESSPRSSREEVNALYYLNTEYLKILQRCWLLQNLILSCVLIATRPGLPASDSQPRRFERFQDCNHSSMDPISLQK